MPTNVGKLEDRAMGVIFTLVGAFVILGIIAAQMPSVLGQVGNITRAFNTLNTGNAILDGLGNPLGLLAGIVLVFGIFRLIRSTSNLSA